MPGKHSANALLFLIGWIVCVLGGTSWWLLIPLGIFAVHFTVISSWAAEGKLVVSVMLAGGALDSFLLQMGVLELPGDPQLIPLWLLAIWGLLGTTLNHCLGWSRRRWWLAGLTGAVLGGLVHLSASIMNVLTLPLGQPTSLLILIASWAIIFPLLHGFAQVYQQQYESRMAGARRK